MMDQASELRRMMEGRAERRATRFRTIAVTSGKGGVGKTNIALNLGLALAEGGIRTALLDADWGLSNADVLLGVSPKRDLRDVLAGSCRMEEIVLDAPKGLKLIPGASGVAELANMLREERERLLGEISKIGDLADIVLLDTAPGISDSVIDLAASADQALIVTTTEPTSLTDAYASAKMILQRHPGANVGLVVNMAPSRDSAVEIAAGFSRVTERFLGQPVPLAGYVCSDSRVGEAVRYQTPLIIRFPDSLAANCLRDLARRLVVAGEGRGTQDPGVVGASI